MNLADAIAAYTQAQMTRQAAWLALESARTLPARESASAAYEAASEAVVAAARLINQIRRERPPEA